VILVYEA